MTGIYKIVNLINGKIYVGQALNIERRISEHKRGKGVHEQSIDKAIQKYGIDNFSYDVIELCRAEELNDREIFWIAHFNSYRRGYNLTSGGQGSPNLSVKLTSKDVEDIYYLLLDYELTQNEIATKFNVSAQTISDINRGKTRVISGYNFPLRDTNIQKHKTIEKKILLQHPKTEYFCECGAKITKDAKQCPTCSRLAQRKVNRPEPRRLAEEIITLGFCATGRKYGVSDNAIRKWCKAYDMPTNKIDLIAWLKH